MPHPVSEFQAFKRRRQCFDGAIIRSFDVNATTSNAFQIRGRWIASDAQIAKR
ncbi:hypothetical protein RRSWK_05186 [Rhodopirellula sp. SWK7]|nr:hypothetical protein RRSWK_05186 [Rhodopirellula sp. SWK7]